MNVSKLSYPHRLMLVLLGAIVGAAYMVSFATAQEPPAPEKRPAAVEPPAPEKRPAVLAVKVDPQTITQGQLLAPKAFRAAVDKVLPSLVLIESRGGVTAAATARQGKIRGISKPGDGPTTGLIVSPDGYIVTSTFNFIRKPPVLIVALRDGTRHVAKLLGRDETRKICMLKIDGVRDLPTPEFVSQNDLQVGQWAISLGVGYGDSEPAVSFGIISATHRISGRAVQTDANISPANYGGPLLDIEGRVIGICSPLNSNSQSLDAGVEWYDSGIGFAIPLHSAEKVLTALREGKTVRPAFLGVATKQPPKEKPGALIDRVVSKTAAAKAGLKKGDVIIKIDSEKIIDNLHLKTVLGRYVAGETAKIVVQRGKEEIEKTVSFLPPPKTPPRAPNRRGRPTPRRPAR